MDKDLRMVLDVLRGTDVADAGKRKKKGKKQQPAAEPAAPPPKDARRLQKS